jgi:hypothetical protein
MEPTSAILPPAPATEVDTDDSWGETPAEEPSGAEPEKKETPTSGANEPEQRPDSQTGEEEEREPESLDGLDEAKRNKAFKSARRRIKKLELDLQRLQQAPAAAPAQKRDEPPAATGKISDFAKPRPDAQTFAGSWAEYLEADKAWLKERDAHIEKQVAERTRKQIEEQRRTEETERQAKEQRAAAEKIRERYDAEYAELATEFPDFEDVAQATKVGEWTQHPDILRWFAVTPGGVRVGYHLAKNPEEVKRIFSPEATFYSAIHQLESLRMKFSEAPKDKKTESTEPKKTKPTRRVVSNGDTPASSLEDDDQWS